MSCTSCLNILVMEGAHAQNENVTTAVKNVRCSPLCLQNPSSHLGNYIPLLCSNSVKTSIRSSDNLFGVKKDCAFNTYIVVHQQEIHAKLNPSY